MPVSSPPVPLLARPAPPLPGPAVSAEPAAAPPHSRVGFFLFLLVNAVVFVRPAEVFVAVLEERIYLILILACLACALPAFLVRLTRGPGREHPITLCLLALFPIILLSLVAHGKFDEVPERAFENAKLLLYFFLFLALVDTPARLRAFMTWVALCATLSIGLAVLDYHGVHKLPAPPLPPGKEPSLEGLYDPDMNRMVGTGLFRDPNDVCVLIVISLVLALYRLSDRSSGPTRFLWLVPLLLFAYAFTCTRSRGGLLALMAALGLLVRLRYGWARALLLGAVAVPLLGGVLATRQMEISTSAGTAQTRLELWSDALVMLRQSPVFGVGMGHFMDENTHVAHNSYLTAFSELGLVGGTLFLGAFFLALWPLYRLTAPAGGPLSPAGRPAPPREVVDPVLRDMRPYLAAAVAGYAVGMVSLTLTFAIPTYIMLALPAVFLPLAVTNPPHPPLKFDLNLLLRLGGVAVAFLLAVHVFVRLAWAV